MKTLNSKQLVEGHGGNLYVVIGGADGSYDVHRVALDHRGTFRRKWQALDAVSDGSIEQIGVGE